MTISWGALGNYLGHRHPTLTVYVAPARYTHELMEHYNRFTIIGFDAPEVNRYMGSRSGRPATEGSTCPDIKYCNYLITNALQSIYPRGNGRRPL